MNQQTTLDSLGLSFPRYLPRGIYKELKQHNRPSSIIMANIRRKEEEDKKVHSSCLFCVIFCVYTIHLDSYFYFVGGNFRCRGFITLPQYSVLLQLDYTLVCVCMYECTTSTTLPSRSVFYRKFSTIYSSLVLHTKVTPRLPTFWVIELCPKRLVLVGSTYQVLSTFTL